MFIWTHDCSIEYILIIGSGGVEGLIDPPLRATPMYFSAKSSSEQSISHFVESHSSRHTDR